MKNKYLLLFAFCLSLFSQPGQAELCGFAFSSIPANKLKAVDWRKEITQIKVGTTIANTDGYRERTLKSATKNLVDSVMEGSTPCMEFYLARGVGENYLTQTGGYGSHTISKLEVSNLGGSGILQGTLLLPVSGHVGSTVTERNANSQRWALTDTYDITMTVNGQTSVLVSGAKSLGIVTIQEISVPLLPGQTARIAYVRSGSAGPAGFEEGRLLDLVWDGT